MFDITHLSIIGFFEVILGFFLLTFAENKHHLVVVD